MFLDRPGRYLVFTTHVRMSVDDPSQRGGKAAKFLGDFQNSPSNRGIVALNMSLANNLKELQVLPGL